MTNGQRGGRSWRDDVWPADNEGHTMSAIPNIGFVATKFSTGKVSEFFEASCSCGWGATIVAGEDDEGIFTEIGFIQSGEDLADGVVGLHDKVAVGAKGTFALPLGRGEDGGMW